MKEKKTKNRKIIVFAYFLLILGIFLVLYPIITENLYKNDVLKEKEKFLERTENQQNLNIYDTLYEKLKLENEQLFNSNQDSLNDPFAFEEVSIDLSLYGIENNIIGYIKIPKIDVELPIYLGANKENLKKGATHLTQTSYPIGGINTNCVIAAHRGYDTMFRYINKLENNDEIIIRNFKEELIYEVIENKVIEVDEIEDIYIQENKDMITLITCHPYGINTQRLLVFAERKN